MDREERVVKWSVGDRKRERERICGGREAQRWRIGCRTAAAVPQSRRGGALSSTKG